MRSNLACVASTWLDKGGVAAISCCIAAMRWGLLKLCGSCATRWIWLVICRRANRASQPFADGQGIAQAPPIHVLEARPHFLRQPRREDRLAHAAHAQHRHHPTVLP